MEKDKSTPEVLHQYNLSRKAIGGIFFDEKKKEKRSVSTIHQVAFDLSSTRSHNSNHDILDEIINTNYETTSVSGEKEKNNDVVFADDEDDEDEFFGSDGGWGWIICFSAFYINLVHIGMMNCYGILVFDLTKEFDESEFKLAWVGSMSFGTVLIFAPVSGYLGARYNCRAVTLVGIIISSISVLLTSLVTNFSFMYLTFGLGFGIGSSLCYTQAAVIVSQYFRKRHAIASGIVLAGSSLGTLFVGKIYDYLHETHEMSWRSILKIIALLIFTSSFGAWTYVPIVKKGDKTARTSPQATKLITELSLWKNKAFIVWMLAIGLVKMGYLIPWVYMVKLSTSYGYSRQFGSNLLQWMGIISTFSRLFVGMIANSDKINRLYLSQFSAACLGLINVIQPNFTSDTGLWWFAISLGVMDGGIEILLPVLTLDLVGEEELAVAWGCILGVISISSVGPPIGGAIYDRTNSYDGMFYFAGAPMIASCFVLALIPLWAKKQPQNPAVSIISVDPSVMQHNEEYKNSVIMNSVIM